MKTIVLFMMLLGGFSIAQEESPQYTNAELGCQTTGFSAGQTITYELIPLGTIFCRDINNRCNMNKATPTNTDFLVQLSGNKYEEASYGFQIIPDCATNPVNPSLDEGIMFHGLFKIIVKIDGIVKATFFYDNRDDSFVTAACGNPGNCNGNDITIRMEGTNAHIHPNGKVRDLERTDPDWKPLDKHGGIINFWEVKDCISRNVSNFTTRPFSVLNIEEYNNHPHLTWTSPQNYNYEVDYYIIERAYESSYNQIGTTSGQAYIDETKTWNEYEDYEYFRYRVVTRFKNGAPDEYSNIFELKRRIYPGRN